MKKKTYQTCLLFASDIIEPEKFKNHIKDQLKLVPILEFKWKRKLFVRKLHKDKKKKRILKKKIKKSSISERLLFRSLKPRAYRGDHISPAILKVENAKITSINDPNYDDCFSPQKYLISHYVFKHLDIFYKVTIDFKLTKEILEFLKNQNFVMFDVVHESQKRKTRINSHSIVVSTQKWKNFSFIHATDLHVAERNDRIYNIIKKWTRLFSGDYFHAFLKEHEDDLKQEGEIPREPSLADNILSPLKKRFINPNNQLRRFIKLINKEILQNKIDFIAITGDIIDFSILSKIPKELRIFDYEHSNWKVFKEIILNLPQKKRKGMRRGEELLCPIFTIPGNHDFRPFHYDMRWAGLYRKLGLKAAEALALNDKFVALPISAIIKSKRSLRAYWLEINPTLDFHFKLGNSNFVFLNTGSDSFKNLRDLLMGHPSLTGLKNNQISYLENLINNKIKPNENTFLFLHAPVINPKKRISMIKRIKHRFGKKVLTKIEEFRESIHKKLGKKTSKSRIDKEFNVKFGTISSNWEKLVEFCKSHGTLTLTGHTHALKEFRLGDPEGSKSKVFNAPPFSLKKVENPAAIYYDSYSEIFTSAKDIEEFGPFVVQTPALGLGGYQNPRQTGAYREIKIKNGKLSSFKVKYLHR